MGKGKKVNSKSNLTESTGGSGGSTAGSGKWKNFYENGFNWIIGCVVLGWILGYVIGSGWTDLTMTGRRIRQSSVYQRIISAFHYNNNDDQANLERNLEFEKDPTHPFTWGLLREAVIRETGGYVYPDLGILSPAPSGAIRGLGMVDDAYQTCQMRCLPGSSQEKNNIDPASPLPASPLDGKKLYKQEEILLKIPLSYQMTRSVAIDTLSALIPTEVQTKADFHSLDDAAMLVLLLAHERGVGRLSRWYPYLLSLPHEPSCGYSPSLRPHLLDALEAMRLEIGMDVEGWPAELVKASQYADRIANGLFTDYGKYIKSPDGVSGLENMQWALCQVASRATAGNDEYGSLRLVPILDLVNHDLNAGGFTELNSTEEEEDDAGSFVIRSLRHGRLRPLRKGQELMANYNVPLYTPLDWFISLGFVPQERWGPWEKVGPVLPRNRKFGQEMLGETERERWEREGLSVLNRVEREQSI